MLQWPILVTAVLGSFYDYVLFARLQNKCCNLFKRPNTTYSTCLRISQYASNFTDFPVLLCGLLKIFWELFMHWSVDLKTKQCLPPTFKLIQSIMYLYIALDFRITNIIEIGTYGNIVNLELLILISKLSLQNLRINA